MEKIYNIIDKNILIKSSFTYNEDEAFLPFLKNSASHYDVEIEFIECEHPINFKTKEIYDKKYIKIYKENDVFIREFIEVFSKKSYGCLIENREGNNYYKCYSYPRAKEKIQRTSQLFEMIGIELILSNLQTFMLHSSYIKYKDNAILFSGPSGIGKSTQANLWELYENAEIINGDRVAINKIEDTWFAYGLPFAGSSKIYKNVKSPIKAIIILRQGNINKIKKLTGYEAFKLIYSETTINCWNSQFIKNVVNLISDLILDVDIYMYECRNDKTAVDFLKNELKIGR